MYPGIYDTRPDHALLVLLMGLRITNRAKQQNFNPPVLGARAVVRRRLFEESWPLGTPQTY